MRTFKKAYVEITNVCNKKCSFCHGTKRVPKEMSEAEFERVLDELKGVTEYIYLHVLGEPLCHPQAIPFINTATARGFKVTVTTNGTLLRDELLDSGLYKFQVSLHSFEGDDEAEKKAYLDRITGVSKKAAERGILVSLRLWNLKTDVSNAFTLDVLESTFPKPWKEGRDNSFTLAKNVFLSFANRFEWPDMEAEEGDDTLFCYGLRDQISILSNGIVVPCCLDAEGDIALGNIYTESLSYILEGDRAKAIYDGFSKRRAVEELCRKCAYAKRFGL